MANPSLSAVICTRNRPDFIGRAVQSVLENDDGDFELIVVDQSGDDATERALEGLRDDPRLQYMHISRAGLSHAYNVAIGSARGQLVAFTDDDCVAPTDWLSSIRREFEVRPDIHLLYGEVRIPPELRKETAAIPALLFRRARRIGPGRRFRVIGMGANFAARRELFDLIGGFDEALGGGGPLCSSQDYDLQFRVYRAGLTTLLSPEVGVLHYGLRTFDEWPKTLLNYGTGDGAFLMKHVRCRDGLAMRLYGRRLLTETARSVSKAMLRRHHSHQYLLGLVRGGRSSLHYKVDRRRRMYVLPS